MFSIAEGHRASPWSFFATTKQRVLHYPNSNVRGRIAVMNHHEAKEFESRTSKRRMIGAALLVLGGLAFVLVEPSQMKGMGAYNAGQYSVPVAMFVVGIYYFLTKP